MSKILDLKGTPKNEQNHLLDSFVTITSTKDELQSTSFLSTLDMDPPTITQLAEQKLSHHELARKLARSIKQIAHDVKDNHDKQYSYEEWVEYTRLIRFTAKDVDDVELDEEEGMIEWDWIGEDSPMMASGTESDFLLERLIESMHRYITRIASNVKMPPTPEIRSPKLYNGKEDGRPVFFASASGSSASPDSEKDQGPLGESRSRDDEDTASLTINMTKRLLTLPLRRAMPSFYIAGFPVSSVLGRAHKPLLLHIRAML